MCWWAFKLANICKFNILFRSNTVFIRSLFCCIFLYMKKNKDKTYSQKGVWKLRACALVIHATISILKLSYKLSQGIEFVKFHFKTGSRLVRICMLYLTYSLDIVKFYSPAFCFVLLGEKNISEFNIKIIT